MSERTVGVDLDGVLANQIEGVLPRIRELYDVALTYDDITDWQLATGPSDIAVEIVKSLKDESYVTGMPVHAGAKEMLDCLRKRHRVVIITARGEHALEWSERWLRSNELQYDEIIGAKEAKKSLHGTDALVDDYLGNIQEFLASTRGVAVLVDQPWNRAGRDNLDRHLSQGRLAIALSLFDVCELVNALLAEPTSGDDLSRPHPSDGSRRATPRPCEDRGPFGRVNPRGVRGSAA